MCIFHECTLYKNKSVLILSETQTFDSVQLSAKKFRISIRICAFVYSDAMRYNEFVHELCENSITLTVAQWCKFGSSFMHGKNTCIQSISNTHTRLCNSLFHAAHHKRAFTPYKIMYISMNLTACLEMCKGLSYTYPYSRSEREILYSLSKFYITVKFVRCVRIDRFSISFSQAYITSHRYSLKPETHTYT